MNELGLQNQPLYFAKVDVKACFDSIPQDKVLSLIRRFMKSDIYALSSTAQVRSPHIMRRPKGPSHIRPKVKFQKHGHPAKRLVRAEEQAESMLGSKCSDTIFVGKVDVQVQKKQALIELLTQHIQSNVVKIGKRFYRQKNGIPQGSIVSSLLCNLFYSTLESGDLSFIKSPNTILLRLIDDFLLISTAQATATKFLQVMHAGIPDFGISVTYYRDILIARQDIPSESIKASLQSFSMRITTNNGSALRLQLQAFLFNTSFNNLTTVLSNLYLTFHTAALRLYEYIRNLVPSKRPPGSLVISKSLAHFPRESRRIWVASLIPVSIPCCTCQPRSVNAIRATARGQVHGSPWSICDCND